ncbi:MAG: undecaprenyl-diphosphate phosphatase [Shimia sp.]
MPLFHLILVALIQGITEFLPISSSGHLILLPRLTGLDDQGVVIDVAAHVGTLTAVVAYFWAEVRVALAGTARLLRGKVDTQGAWLALCLAIATVPVIVLGLVLSVTGWHEAMRSIAVIGWTMILFGLLLYWADQRAPQERGMERWSLQHAVLLGLWQAVALIPGTSRSGIVITGALVHGYTRRDAARIAMLMSIPTILASGAVTALDLGGVGIPWRDAGIVAGLSAVAAFAALAVMMRLLRSVSFTPYVVYRVAFGLLLLWIAYA